MHIQTHVMSGWCIANLLPLTAAQRLGCMIAASVCDLDGLSLIGGWDAYSRYHHVLGHNLAFGLLACAVLTACTARLRAAPLVFVLYLGLFHLHLLMDYFGSGFGWGIAYFSPMASREYKTTHGWEFYSWQNISLAMLLLLWTLVLAVRVGRTPLEAIMPGLDRKLVVWLQRYARPFRA